MVETLSTSQTSSSPPHNSSGGHSRPTLERLSASEQGSETDTYTSGDRRSGQRQHFRRDRKSSFNSMLSHVSGYGKWGKGHGNCMILIKTRQAGSDEEKESSGLSNENAMNNESSDWRIAKKLSIEVDVHDHASSHSRSSRNIRSRSGSSVHHLPTIPSEDMYETEEVSRDVDAIVIDNDDDDDDDNDNDDDDDSGMYFYDENNGIVVEGGDHKSKTVDLDVSIDSIASEDGTSFFGEFEIDGFK